MDKTDLQSAFESGDQARQVSSAAKAYFEALDHNLSLFNLFIHLTLQADYVSFVAEQALDDKDWKTTTPTGLAKSDPGPTVRELRKHRQEFLEMFVARIVDNFQCYIVELLREVLRKRPEILKSQEPSVSVETVLNFSSREELVHHLIERKINTLVYQGFAELQEWCTRRGIPIVIPGLQPKYDVPEMIAIRNIIVHNRGLVDEKYLKSTKDCTFKTGDTRHLDSADLFGAVDLMSECVLQTDNAAVTKFNLPTTSDIVHLRFKKGPPLE